MERLPYSCLGTGIYRTFVKFHKYFMEGESGTCQSYHPVHQNFIYKRVSLKELVGICYFQMIPSFCAHIKLPNPQPQFTPTCKMCVFIGGVEDVCD